jgi:hypothetical protein
MWIDGAGKTRLQMSFFEAPEEVVISCLHSIAKTLTILGFDHSTIHEGRETAYVVEDGIGRCHPVVQVKRISRKGSRAVDITIAAEVEQMLSLLLEKNLMMVELEN